MSRKPGIVALLLAAPLAVLAAEGPIQDNSFLVEEAYNQEDGVVQHINTFQRFRGSNDWIYTFTQEWPVGGLKHQLSYTVPVLRTADSPDARSGIGDVAINYRYQLVGDGEAALAIAPRFSVFAPSGNEKQGRGAGATGYQAWIPVSVVLSPALVAHSNLGFTWTPRARDADGNRANLESWSVGQSVVWLASRRVNFLLEAVYSWQQEVAGNGTTNPARSAFVSPGMRWSYDFESGLQIVPGIAFPSASAPAGARRASSSISASSTRSGNRRSAGPRYVIFFRAWNSGRSHARVPSTSATAITASKTST